MAAANHQKRDRESKTASEKGKEMSRPQSADSLRRTPVLDLSQLTVMELGALVDALRDAQLQTDVLPGMTAIWEDMCILRMEARSEFIRKFFEVR
jgi:hypothetical protein